MKDQEPVQPDCFADIGKVFPMGPDGLRAAPAECMACGLKTDCLRTALSREHEKAMPPVGERPGCFGDISKVFPEGDDGLRVSPAECFACDHKTPCLKSAISGSEEGVKFENERVDRAHDAGSIGFLTRWSRKKSLSRRLSKMPSEKK